MTRALTCSLQLAALHQAGIADGCLYSGTAIGKNGERNLVVCPKALREGEALMIWRLDRLGRSVSDLVRIIGELEKQSIGLGNLTEKNELVHQGHRKTDMLFHLVICDEAHRTFGNSVAP